MRKLLSFKNVKQFLSYFGVGGAAAVVEWICFTIFISVLGLPYLLATILAFLISTTVNWILGRIFTFKDSAYKEKNERLKEVILVFFVSAIGLGFNMLLMYLFVDVIGMKSSLQQTIAKVLATGIVFIWNYLSRKLWIYREPR